MKVGILTFHFCHNYGATLQCYGLFNTLMAMGHDVDVIDYRPTPQDELSFWQGWGLRKPSPMLNIRKRWIDLRYGDIMREQFNKFNANNMTFSEKCDDSNVADVIATYDALVVGSDQVWNRNLSTVSPVYFLHFNHAYRGRKVSYAACCGHKEMPQEGMYIIKSALQNFDFISVRNGTTHEWLHELTGISAEIVCDPALLCEYSDIKAVTPPPYQRYILAYALGREIDGGDQQAVAEIKRTHGNLPVVWICPSAHKPEKHCQWADQVEYSAGPAEWLRLIADASFVYTDSFHGVIFSMKYRRPFFAYYQESMRAQRLMDVAERYGVGSVIASGLPDALARRCFEQKLDYQIIEERIAAHTTLSRKFLSQALS